MYISTRNKEIKTRDTLAVIDGIAPDGGLYFPDDLSDAAFDWERVVMLEEREISAEILSKFLPSFSKAELTELVGKAYKGKFDSDEIAPTKKVGDLFVTELFHGPTCAFKDVALSVLPHVLTASLKKEGISDEVVILTATSGDTGKAALAGFKDVENTKIIVFYPDKKVSEIQRIQMVSQTGKNVSVCGIKGNFDDAQTGVKNIFTSAGKSGLLEHTGKRFSSANSINIARLCPQIMYYFKAYGTLVKSGEIKMGEKINFAVPTGNFGNILAGFLAYKLGLPVGKFICASNENHILTDFINTGIYDKRREFIKTASPSMDILVSSNLERLLFLLSGDDSAVNDYMTSLNRSGYYKIPDELLGKIKEMFFADFLTDAECFEEIRNTFEKEHYLSDTHTATALGVARRFGKLKINDFKTVVISTASPYKFAVSVSDAVGVKHGDNEFETMRLLSEKTGTAIPTPLKNLENAVEIHTAVCEKEEMLDFVKERCNIR